MNDSVRLIVTSFLAAVAAMTLASCSNTAVGVRSAIDVPVVGSAGQGAIVTSDFSVGTSYGLAFEADFGPILRGRIETTLRNVSVRSELGTIRPDPGNPRPTSGYLDAQYQLIDIPAFVTYLARGNDHITPFFGFGGVLTLGRGLTWNAQYTNWSLNDDNEWYRYTVNDEHTQGALEAGFSALFTMGTSFHLATSLDAQVDVRLAHRLSDPSVSARWSSERLNELYLPTTSVVFGAGIVIRL